MVYDQKDHARLCQERQAELLSGNVPQQGVSEHIYLHYHLYRALHRPLQNALRSPAACVRRKPAGSGVARHQCYQNALRRCADLRRARGHGRLCLCHDDGQLQLERRRGGLRLPRSRGYDLRQLEAAERCGRRAAVRSLQVHRSVVLHAGHQRRRHLLAEHHRPLPYLITLIVLAFTSKSSRAPKAEGIPYDKGTR